jgi:hypothetical protein
MSKPSVLTQDAIYDLRQQIIEVVAESADAEYGVSESTSNLFEELFINAVQAVVTDLVTKADP